MDLRVLLGFMGFFWIRQKAELQGASTYGVFQYESYYIQYFSLRSIARHRKRGNQGTRDGTEVLGRLRKPLEIH